MLFFVCCFVSNSLATNNKSFHAVDNSCVIQSNVIVSLFNLIAKSLELSIKRRQNNFDIVSNLVRHHAREMARRTRSKKNYSYHVLSLARVQYGFKSRLYRTPVNYFETCYTPYSKMASILVFSCLLANQLLLSRLRENIFFEFQV